MDEDIREMLRERADDVTARPSMPAATLRRAKRRRVATGGGALVGIVAMAVAGISIAGALRRDDALEPVAPRPKVDATFRIGPDVSDLSYGFGSLWYATRNALLRVDPETGKVVATIDAFPRETSPDSGIATVSNRIAIGEGAVWLLVADNGTRTGPVSTSSTATTGPGNRRTFSQSLQSSISAAPSGFREHWALVRVDPATNNLRSSALVFDSMPVSVSVDGGSVWVATNGYTRSPDEPPGWISRFDAGTLKLRSTFALEETPTHVVARGESLWVTVGGTNGRILRIDSRTGRRLAHIVVRSPGDIVVAGDYLWTTTDGDTNWAMASFHKQTLLPSRSVQLGKKPEFTSELAFVGDRLWIIDVFSGTLQWVDPRDGLRGDPADLFTFPAHVSVDANGLLWVAGGSANQGTIWRVDVP